MKSSVRILAIALALAFLLLARSAFQEGPASAADDIDLKDGEASFADLLDGTMEAEYLGLEDGSTSTVYFYIDSDALSTQVTARVLDAADAADNSFTPTPRGSTDVSYQLRGGNTIAARVENVGTDGEGIGGTAVGADTTATVEALDTAYCAEESVVVVTYTDDHPQPDAATTSISVSGWGLATTTVGEDGACDTGDELVPADATNAGSAITIPAGLMDQDNDDDVDVTDARIKFAQDALDAINDDEVDAAEEANHLVYMYKSGTKYVAATSTTPARRYTDDHDGRDDAGVAQTGDALFGPVGDSTRPLDSVSFTYTDTTTADPPVTGDRVNVPTFVTSGSGNMFRLAFAPDGAGGDTRERRIDLTYDIVDVYEHDANAKRASDAYAEYTSGYKRVWVSSNSDSGQWVTIREVAGTTANEAGDPSATSNLFQGVVVITNDTGLDDLNDDGTDDTIYVQDGDTLTVQAFSSNNNRGSNVLASATATIDDSAPTISDLSPADETVTNDESLRISFSVNDEGAGVEFRDVPMVVTNVEAQARADSGDEPRGMGKPCPLVTTLADLADPNDSDIGNAGGNSSRVGILIAPGSTNFTDRCSDVVNTSFDGPNSDGKKFNLIITAQDLAGNVTKHTTQLTIDGDKPRVPDNPEAGNAWDADKNKSKSSANSILVPFNESLDVDTVVAADFTVTGYSIDSVEVVGTNEDDGEKNLNEYVVLTLTEDLANNARPSVTVSGVSDVAGNSLDTVTLTSDNKIKSAITVVPFAALIAEDGQQAITFTTDEALRSKSGDNSTEGSVGDDKVKITVADDTMGGNATFKESTYGGSRAYGVLLQVVDVDGNPTKTGEVKVSDEAYELTDDVTDGAKFDVTLDNWPLADTGFDNDVTGEVKAYIGKTMVASSTNEVDWTDGSVELQASAGRSFDEGDKINLSYSYVNADQVIQVDVDEPTMTSIPADNAETDYAAGAIQFKWTEDKEYAGDTYKTVTLNEASHEGPNGTSTDILDMLTTHDDKTWVYRPAADLALGDNEFTLKATDAAGNSNEVSVTITVIERKPVKINLSPGWNLISLPGMPASADVNDVFSSDTVSVISQYDGRRVSPWTVWTRGSDGSLSSSPAGRTTIDSGLGLWVLSSDGSALEVDIPGTSKDSPAEVPPSIDLIVGWNLVAVILISEDEVGVNEYLPEGVWTRAFRLSNTTGQFESFSPPSTSTTTETPAGEPLNAGDALWVYATKAGTIVPK